MNGVVDVTVSRLIRCERNPLAAFASNPDNATRWYTNIESVEWRTAPPVSIGSRVTFVARFLGRHLEYTYEIAEYTPGSMMRMTTSDGPFPMETTYRWIDGPNGGTTMTLRNYGSPKGFSRLLSPFIRFAMRSAMTKDLERLARILESELSAGSHRRSAAG